LRVLVRVGQLACRYRKVETSARHIACRWDPGT
jgi:hypothetical protein